MTTFQAIQKWFFPTLLGILFGLSLAGTLGWVYSHSTLSGLTVEKNGVTYECAESDETLWVCFETFETFWGFEDYRVAFDYNPKTDTVLNIAHYGDERKL